MRTNTSALAASSFGQLPNSNSSSNDRIKEIFTNLNERIDSNLRLRTHIKSEISNESDAKLTQNIGLDKLIGSVVPSITQRSPREVPTFSPLQEWEGYVVDVAEDSFRANLVDITAGKNFADEAMEFLISELSDDDQGLLSVGAIFRWSIGYEKLRGSKKRTSQIIFRRLPAVMPRDIEAAKKRAEKILGALVWE